MPGVISDQISALLPSVYLIFFSIYGRCDFISVRKFTTLSLVFLFLKTPHVCYLYAQSLPPSFLAVRKHAPNLVSPDQVDFHYNRFHPMTAHCMISRML